MVSKAQSNYIRSLATVAGRTTHHAYLVEGPKLADEWLRNDSKRVQMVVATASWIEKNQEVLSGLTAPVYVVEPSRLQALSQLKGGSEVLLVAAIHEKPLVRNGWTLLCETLQDPGNLGTILRIADWYGIPGVFTTADSADFYNPKVVQAGMGAHLRVALHRGDAGDFLKNDSRPVYAATLQGESLYQVAPSATGILLIGNESKGLSAPLVEKATQQVTIPRRGGAESLNAAVATGILCDRLLAAGKP